MENFFLDEYTRCTNELYSVLGLPWSFGGTKWTRGVVSRGVQADIGVGGCPLKGRERERDRTMTWKRGRERSGCIDRRHKIHFMTWTLSSDWCISRRIASQIKRSSTLEPPLTTSPHPCRRRTVVRRHQLSFVFRVSSYRFPFFLYFPHPYVPVFAFRARYTSVKFTQAKKKKHPLLSLLPFHSFNENLSLSLSLSYSFYY